MTLSPISGVESRHAIRGVISCGLSLDSQTTVREDSSDGWKARDQTRCERENDSRISARPDGRFNLSAVEVEYQRGSVRGLRFEHVANRCHISPWPTLNTLCRHYAALTNSHSRAPRKPELLPLAVRESEHSVVPRVLARTDIPGANASIGTKLEALPRLASERIPVAGIACAVRNCRTTNLPAVPCAGLKATVSLQDYVAVKSDGAKAEIGLEAQESTNSNPTKAVRSRQWTPAAAGNSL